MKVLYIDHYAGSDSMGMEFRPVYLARAWRRMGIDTVILAADYSHLRRKNPEVAEDLQEEVIDAVPFVFLKTRRYSGNGKDRVLSMLEFTAKGRRAAKTLATRYRPDVVICSSTYPLDTYIGQAVARQTGALLIHEIHDLWPLSPRLLGGYSAYHPFIVGMGLAEKSAYRAADAIVSVLPNAAAHIKGLGFATTPVVYIPNGLPQEVLERGVLGGGDAGASDLIRRLHASGAYVVGYAGGLSTSNAMDDFVQAMSYFKDDPSVQAVLIGGGKDRALLEAQAQAFGLTNITFVAPIAKEDVVATLCQMDALYIGAAPSPLYEYGVSANKIFDYLLAGVPIINAWNAAASPLEEVGTCLRARGGDAKEIARAVRASREISPERREEIRRINRAFVRTHHNYDKLAAQFARLFSLERRNEK
ncbi:Glycosyltransferase [Clostridiaceae bacterium JG1575]|nr:Glycosyltransferase [Clostridiaceae bacterium JG1575]